MPSPDSGAWVVLEQHEGGPVSASQAGPDPPGRFSDGGEAASLSDNSQVTRSSSRSGPDTQVPGPFPPGPTPGTARTGHQRAARQAAEDQPRRPASVLPSVTVIPGRQRGHPAPSDEAREMSDVVSPALFPDTVTCVAPCGAPLCAVVSDNGRFPYTGTTGGLTKTIAGANGYTWSAARCSAGTSSSMRRPRSSSRPPSRPRSEPVRLPGHRAGAGVDPLPTASRCSDGGSRPERKDEPPLVGWWPRGWPPSSVRIPGPRTADTGRAVAGPGTSD